MPCYDSRSDQDARECEQRKQLATRVACELWGHLKRVAYTTDFGLVRIQLSRETADWVSEHEKMDKSQAIKRG